MSSGSLGARARDIHIDHVRMALAALVIVFHLTTQYGNVGRWPYQETQSDILSQSVYSVPFAIVQAFLMPLWFLVAGYFSAQTISRRGARSFLAQRAARLGVPMLFYDLLVQPTLWYLNGLAAGTEIRPLWLYLVQPPFSEGIGSGPLWYLLELLLFSAVLAGLAARWPDLAARPIGFVPRTRHLIYLGFGIAVLAFVARLGVPMTQTLTFVNLPLGDLPKHAGLYCAGVLAARGDWLRRMPVMVGAGGLGISLGMLAALPPVLAGAFLSEGRLDALAFLGGWSWQAAFYAGWDSFVAVGMSAAVLVFFRERLSTPGRLTGLSASAYAVYLIHTPVTVGIGYALSGLDFHPLVKWLMASLIAVPACFAIAHFILRRIPTLRHLLFSNTSS